MGEGSDVEQHGARPALQQDDPRARPSIDPVKDSSLAQFRAPRPPQARERAPLGRPLLVGVVRWAACDGAARPRTSPPMVAACGEWARESSVRRTVAELYAYA
eukprot:SAG11_NODE_21_length_25065_cov_3.589081_10_plen_103_part_00